MSFCVNVRLIKKILFASFMSRQRYSRLSEKEKKQIVQMRLENKWSVSELAEMFRVTKRRIYQLIDEAVNNDEEE